MAEMPTLGRTRRRPRGGGVVIVFLLLIGGAGWWWMHRRHASKSEPVTAVREDAGANLNVNVNVNVNAAPAPISVDGGSEEAPKTHAADAALKAAGLKFVRARIEGP